MRDQVNGDGPARARAIVDHDLLPKRLADPFEHDARNQVHHPGRGERHHRANGARRIVLRPRTGARPSRRNCRE
jgi:hypothetical protein